MRSDNSAGKAKKDQPNHNEQFAQLPNILVHYSYRDASNYKSHGDVVFANPKRASASEIWLKLNKAVEDVTLFPDTPLFRPEWVGLPTVFLFEKFGFYRNSDDHDWHELTEVEETNEPSSFEGNLTIDGFIEKLIRTHKKQD